MDDKNIMHKVKGDRIIWAMFILLCLVSVIEVFSASSGLTYRAESYWSPMLKHVGLLAVGWLFVIATMNIKCKYFKLITPFALLFSTLMLIAVLFIGQTTNGAQRWISLFGIQFQPSELAKGAVVLAVAQVLSAMQTENGADRRAFKYIMSFSLPVLFLIGIENLSTAALLFLTIVLMMIVGRVPKGQLGRLFGFIAICGVVIVAVVMTMGEKDADQQAQTDKSVMVDKAPAAATAVERSPIGKIFHRMGTWRARIESFLDGEKVAPADYDLDKDAQVAHANIAIVSSNVIGKGPGNSVERDFLSQAFSDFIYAIIIEELGIGGAAGVLFLYIVLLFRTAIIANRCVNAFPALLIMGIALLLVTQAMFNMAVAVGLLPVTGQPLPLISKGGTSTIINCIYIGIILSVSYSAKKREEVAETVTQKVPTTVENSTLTVAGSAI